MVLTKQFHIYETNYSVPLKDWYWKHCVAFKSNDLQVHDIIAWCKSTYGGNGDGYNYHGVKAVWLDQSLYGEIYLLSDNELVPFILRWI